MKIENIFTEFMALYYKSNGVRPSLLKDIPIQSGVIARCTDVGCTIYYLTMGNYIRIPWEFMDLFFSLNTYSGNRIISLSPENNIEKFIQSFVLFTGYLSNSNEDYIVSSLSNIVDLGTKEFREWYKDKFNRTLEPIEFFSINKNFEI